MPHAGPTAEGVRAGHANPWQVKSALDRLVREVNKVCRAEPLDHVYRIGELVIAMLYDGDVEAWRRERVKRASYRSLACRQDLLLSPSALCRSVGVYALARRVGGFRRWTNVGVSHYQEVLPLPAASQERLLTQCDEERWTVAMLRSQVRRVRQELGRATKQRENAVRLLLAALSKLERASELTGMGLADEHLDQQLNLIVKLRAELDCLDTIVRRRAANAAVPSQGEEVTP